MNEEFLDNQTLFAEEEPLHVGSYRKKVTVEELKKQKKKPTMLIIGAAFLILLVIVTSSVLILKNNQQSTVTVEPTPTPTVIPQNPDQIEQLLKELESAIREADPSETTLPFPPVSEQIRISQ